MARTPVAPLIPDRPLTAPSTLNDDARTVFAELVTAVGPGHFRPVDRPLVASYSEALCLARRAHSELSAQGPVDEEGRISPWLRVYDSAMKAVTGLAARLRVCPQSRLDRTRAGVTTRTPTVPQSPFEHYFTGTAE